MQTLLHINTANVTGITNIRMYQADMCNLRRTCFMTPSETISEGTYMSVLLHACS